MTFDDSFEHEVVNDTDSIRAVLLLRFWHPLLAKQDRSAALQAAIDARQNDELQRYNPPLPESNSAVRSRGMTVTDCSLCGQSGYASIRMVKEHSFSCTCGNPIQ